MNDSPSSYQREYYRLNKIFFLKNHPGEYVLIVGGAADVEESFYKKQKDLENAVNRIKDPEAEYLTARLPGTNIPRLIEYCEKYGIPIYKSKPLTLKERKEIRAHHRDVSKFLERLNKNQEQSRKFKLKAGSLETRLN